MLHGFQDSFRDYNKDYFAFPGSTFLLPLMMKDAPPFILLQIQKTLFVLFF